MHFIGKRRARLFLIATGTVMIFQLSSGCFSFRMSTSEVEEYFAQSSQKPNLSTYKVDGQTINYAEIGSDTLPTAIFFHGSPGSWSAFIHFMKDQELLNKVRMVSVDRPGFGHSDFGNGEESLKRQAEMLRPVLEKYKNRRTILIGHSLGGPLIARLAMDFPEMCDALVMVAPSIDPDLEPEEDWFRFPLHTPFLSWLLPTSLRVSNDEIYFLEDELREMVPLWKNITQPVTVIQGTADNLVPPENADFAARMLVNAESVDLVIEEGMNHFIPWQAPQLMKTAILKYAQ